MTPIPPRTVDLRGKQFGLLTVLEYAGKIGNSRHAWWSVQCACPLKTIKNVVGTSLTGGGARSCGCLVVEVGKRNKTHGMSGTPEYEAWLSARKRTRDPNHPQFKDYGGRIPPVTMSDDLYDHYELFFAEVGFRTTPDHSLDRKDNNGNYERGNLKWSTAREQALNRRTNRYLDFKGVRKAWAEWDREYGFPKGTTKNRVKLGWSAEMIFSTPVRIKTKPRRFKGGVRKARDRINSLSRE